MNDAPTPMTARTATATATFFQCFFMGVLTPLIAFWFEGDVEMVAQVLSTVDAPELAPTRQTWRHDCNDPDLANHSQER